MSARITCRCGKNYGIETNCERWVCIPCQKKCRLEMGDKCSEHECIEGQARLDEIKDEIKELRTEAEKIKRKRELRW